MPAFTNAVHCVRMCALCSGKLSMLARGGATRGAWCGLWCEWRDGAETHGDGPESGIHVAGAWAVGVQGSRRCARSVPAPHPEYGARSVPKPHVTCGN